MHTSTITTAESRQPDAPIRPRSVTGLVRRHPILSFVFLACLFGWAPYIAAMFGWGTHPENLPLGPLPAALIVAACQGRAELRSWALRLRSWRAAPKWYLLAILAPPALHLVDVLVNHALGAPLPTMDQLASWPSALASFVVFLVLVGIGEEAGWIAFVAPILLRRHGLLAAWAIASAIRIGWHLPLMISGDLSWTLGVVGNAAFTMLMLQLFIASGGRWTLVAVWHASLNAFGSGFFFQFISGADNARLGVLLSVAYTVVATITCLVARQRRGQ
jgi:membrane protease YdiL (CAAX protease family)